MGAGALAVVDLRNAGRRDVAGLVYVLADAFVRYLQGVI